jgi:pseudouridine synthase
VSRAQCSAATLAPLRGKPIRGALQTGTVARTAALAVPDRRRTTRALTGAAFGCALLALALRRIRDKRLQLCYHAAARAASPTMKQIDGRNDRPAAGERIAKAIARAGLASRREAEAWIAAGRVAVNGEVIASPARNVTADDRITVDGAPLPVRERTRLFLYHKPRGLLTTHADPGGRPTIFSALPKGLPRLVSVGRLDLNTEGLLLLTNDGGLARTLELPATGWLRRYRVRAHGRVTQDELDRLRAGVTIDGVRYGAIEATVDRVQGSNAWLTFAIREGKNREVKNVLGHLGLAVNRLIRVSFGPFRLGELAPGAVEEVRTRTLREQLGERVAALAGADFAAPRVEREAHSGGLEGVHKSRIAKSVVPAKAGTHRAPHRGLWNMGPQRMSAIADMRTKRADLGQARDRVRGDDKPQHTNRTLS